MKDLVSEKRSPTIHIPVRFVKHIRRGDEQKCIGKQKNRYTKFQKPQEKPAGERTDFCVVESQQALNLGAQAWYSLLALAVVES